MLYEVITVRPRHPPADLRSQGAGHPDREVLRLRRRIIGSGNGIETRSTGPRPGAFFMGVTGVTDVAAPGVEICREAFEEEAMRRILGEVVVLAMAVPVITSYSIHYTKLYEP